MRAYLNLLRDVLENGIVRPMDVQGVGNKVVFGRELRFSLSDGFPLLTTKRVFFRGVVEELLWFLRGESRVDSLRAADVYIWDPWATAEYCAQYGREPGDLGPIYGPQWRKWKTRDGREIDQVKNLINEIKNHVESKRMMVTGWNPEDVDTVFVAPCHGVPWKCCVAGGEISLINVQRSADLFLGVPFNIASYAALLMMIAQVTGLKAKECILYLMDCHLYLNQVAAAEEQLRREPRPLPQLVLNPAVTDIDGFSFADFKLTDYHPHPKLEVEVAV